MADRPRQEAAQKAFRAKLDASPDAASCAKEFGANSVVHHADGSWTCTVKDKEKFRRAEAMMSGIRRIDSERGEAVAADVPRETVREANGQVVNHYVSVVERNKAHVRPVIHWGRPKVRIVYHANGSRTRYHADGRVEEVA